MTEHDYHDALARLATAAAPAPTLGNQPLLNAIADGIVQTAKHVKAACDAKLETQAARIATLEQRLAALEKKPHVRFAGTWASGKSYTPGDAVVRSGSLWVCHQATAEESWDHAAWQLAVKRGSA